MSKKSSAFAFTLIELLVVISIIALLLGILVPVLGLAKRNAALTKEAVNARTLQLGMVSFAASNKEWYPGLTSAGDYFGTAYIGNYYKTAAGTGTAETLEANNVQVAALLLDEQMAMPAHWISPGENGQTSNGINPIIAVATTGTRGNPITVTGLNSSFALLAYGFDPVFKGEWRSTQNSKSILVASRMVMGTAGFSSLWTDENANRYRGSLARGDSSTSTMDMAKADIQNGSVAGLGLLKYGPAAAAPSTSVDTTSTVGIFGKSTAAANFSATQVSGTFTKGLIGSSND